MREISRALRRLAGGPAVAAARAAVQYADFALWQRRWLAGEALDRHLDYWRERLRGLPAELELPADRPRPAERSWHGAEHRFALDAPLAADLVALARREGVTGRLSTCQHCLSIRRSS